MKTLTPLLGLLTLSSGCVIKIDGEVDSEVEWDTASSEDSGVEEDPALRDDDGDGYSEADGDCDDTRPDVFPGAAPSGCYPDLDEDCDGEPDYIGAAQWRPSEGEPEDLTETFAGGSAEQPLSYSLDEPGALGFCEGQWFVQLDVRSDSSVVGLGASGPAILDGGGSGRVINMEGAYHLELRDLTLQAGEAGSYGGGALNVTGGSSVTVVDSVLQHSHAQRGGAVSVQGTESLIMERVQFVENVAEQGGHLYLSDTSAQLSELSLEGGQALLGGGVFVYDADLQLQSSALSGNSAEDSGGALLIWGEETERSVTLSELQLKDNVASLDGGAIAVYGQPVSLEQIVAEGNRGAYGGFLLLDSAEGSLLGGELSANEADYGAGICSFSSDLVLEQSALSAQSARYGGGIYQEGGELQLREVSLSENQGSAQGGGLALSGVSGEVQAEVVSFSGNHPEDVAGAETYLWDDTVSFRCARGSCSLD